MVASASRRHGGFQVPTYRYFALYNDSMDGSRGMMDGKKNDFSGCVCACVFTLLGWLAMAGIFVLTRKKMSREGRAFLHFVSKSDGRDEMIDKEWGYLNLLGAFSVLVSTRD